MKKVLCLLLAMLMTLSLAAAVAEETAQEPAKVRTIVTADWLDDDQCSLIRYLLYSNEFETAGIIADKTAPGDYPIAGSTYELGGKTVENRDIAQYFIDVYAEDYENLLLHDPDYPDPEYLTSINVNGSINNNDMEPSEGSELIKACILDDREDMLFIQCWGGTGTLAAALKSIEDEYKDTDEWEAIQQKVYDKVVVWHDLGQDSCYDTYIIPNWPNLYSIMSYSQFGAMVMFMDVNIPNDQVKYYAGEWVAEYIANDNSALSRAYYEIKGDHKATTTERVGYPDPQAAIVEGDTPNFFYILDNGLRQLEDPSYGGWGGRFAKASRDIFMITRGGNFTNFWVDTDDDGDIYKPIYRWTEDFQNEFAARMEWTYASYEEANHEPVVTLDEGIDFTAQRGETITLTAQTSDPDGDAVTVSFWQYGDADTYGGDVELIPGEGDQISFVVPEDAKIGDTIHIIVEAQDDYELPITRYQRAIVTVVDAEAEAE